MYLLWYSGAGDSDILKEVHQGLVLLDFPGIECQLFKNSFTGLASIELLFILASLEVEDEVRNEVNALWILGKIISSERDLLLADQTISDISICE